MKVAVGIAILALCTSTGCADDPALNGKWHSVRRIDTWPTKVTTQDDIDGKRKQATLEIRGSRVRLNGKSCKVYEQKTFTTDDEALKWLYQNKIDYTALHTHAPLTFIDSECTTILRGSDDRLFFDIDGDFYEAARSKADK